MTKIIIDDPNMRRGNPDNEEMRTEVLVSEDVTPWQEQTIDRKALRSPEPLRHVHKEPNIRAPMPTDDRPTTNTQVDPARSK